MEIISVALATSIGQTCHYRSASPGRRQACARPPRYVEAVSSPIGSDEDATPWMCKPSRPVDVIPPPTSAELGFLRAHDLQRFFSGEPLSVRTANR
jgi:hypothetical protein